MIKDNIEHTLRSVSEDIWGLETYGYTAISLLMHNRHMMVKHIEARRWKDFRAIVPSKDELEEKCIALWLEKNYPFEPVVRFNSCVDPWRSCVTVEPGIVTLNSLATFATSHNFHLNMLRGTLGKMANTIALAAEVGTPHASAEIDQPFIAKKDIYNTYREARAPRSFVAHMAHAMRRTIGQQVEKGRPVASKEEILLEGYYGFGFTTNFEKVAVSTLLSLAKTYSKNDFAPNAVIEVLESYYQ